MNKLARETVGVGVKKAEEGVTKRPYVRNGRCVFSARYYRVSTRVIEMVGIVSTLYTRRLRLQVLFKTK